MGNAFESVRKYDDNLELAPDSFRFQSAGKKYINQNYKRIGHVLGVEGEWLGVIKRRANSENRLPDIHGDLSLKQINFYREHYDFPPLTQDEYEAIKAQNTSSEVIKDEKSGEVLKEVDHVGINLEDQEPIPTGEVVTADIDAESQSDGVEVQGSRETDQEAQTDVGTGDTINEPESVPKNSIESSLDDGGVDDLFENLPEAEALQAELDRLIEVEVQKLQSEQTTENISYKIDREKLENFKENARKTISDYQQFANEHSSLVDKSNPRIQERYQLLEKQAWNSLYNLAHLLDGEIATLPQDRDIQVSHPEGADIRQYLEARGYKFDENGDVTHIADKGVEIELNRAIKTDSLIKSKRPSHIVYDKSISLDSDFNYQGYLVRGLNQQTPDFIVGVLDKDRLESVIVDETLQSNNLSEGVQDPWAEEVKGATEFDKIFADSLKYNNETQISDEMSDPWVEKSETEEPPIIPVFTIPSGDNPDLQSEGTYPLGEEGLETTPQVSLDDLRLAYARAEEAWNRKPGDGDLEDAFMVAREAYNTELERVLKLQVAEGQEANIHQMFKDEVLALRDSRKTQSQELQGKWEKRFNNAKEKFLGWATKNKRNWMMANIGLMALGGGLASTGVGVPLALHVDILRRSLGSVMSGVGARNTLVGLMEDRDIRINKGFIKINFQAVVPKIVRESISESDEQIKQVSDEVLQDRLGTLDAYYRLNGGKFTKENQQQAYEKVLTELARRVQENVIDVENPNLSIQPLTPEQLEKNKKLYGWVASYELAKIAKSQNIDLSLLSREDYADFAIQNKLRIDDTQLRMSPWQRMCESVDEVREGDKERQSLINSEAHTNFDKFSLEIKQKAGDSDRNIDNNIIVRQGTKDSEHWLYFGINQGADSREDQIFKSYISLQDLNTLTPDKFTDFMRALRDSGYNGDIKVFQDLLSQGIRLNDQIVMHGASEADAKLGLDVADQFFGDSLAHKSLGIDKKINGKSYSYSQVLAQNIKNSIQDSSSAEEQNPSTEVLELDRQELETDRYTSELLNTISDTRIAELDKFRRKRKIATGIGVLVTGIGAGALLNDMVKPGSMFRPDMEGSGKPHITDGSTPEVSPPSATEIPPTGTGEALRQAREAAATAEQAQELAQDVSSLDSGETIWGEITKQLGENASQAQIQQAVENYLQSELGQESLYKLAQGTEGGRELLSQWGIDNIGEMSSLSKEQLFEISKYLAPGELEGITELSLDNLNALEQAVVPEVTGSPTIEPGSTEPPSPPAGTEDIVSKPPAPPSPLEAPPVATSEFAKDLSEILGKQNLTDIQAREIVQSYFADDYGREAIYNSIINTGEGSTVLSNGFGVNTLADFANLTPDQMYEITNNIDSNELRKILNQTILSRFEDAPDMVELTRGTNSLNVVQRYIANELGNLPYDTNLGKQVLDTYLQTDSGKQWLYDAIVNNPDINNQNIQYFKEYLRFKGITSPEEFVDNFNWAEFSGNRNIPTSGFWNQIRLPNGGTRLQPLSTFLQPSQMLGIKDAVLQVLTK